MAKKKVLYQITRTRYEMVEVETEEQEELIKELNRDFEREDKREKTARARAVSLDYLYESEGYEAADTEPTAEERCIEKADKELFNARLHKAIDSLTKRQKEIVVKVYFENKTQAEIARELGVSEAIISKTMKRALGNLKKYLGEE